MMMMKMVMIVESDGEELPETVSLGRVGQMMNCRDDDDEVCEGGK